MHHIFDIDLIALWCHGYFSLLETMAGRYTEEEIAKSSIVLPPFMFSVYMSGSRWRPNDQIISLTSVSLLKLLNNSLNLNNIFNFWDEDQSSILTKKKLNIQIMRLKSKAHFSWEKKINNDKMRARKVLDQA